MAFSSTITERYVVGDRVKVFGTYTNGTGDDFGGEVATGLIRVDTFFSQATSGTGTITNSVTETFPLAGGSVTIATAGNEDGTWEATGID